MKEQMTFPNTWEEFEQSYGFDDEEQIYTNGSRLIQTFRVKQWLEHLPSAVPMLREKALLLLLDWAVECGFGFDNIPEEYELYKKDIENMGYCEGLIYIAEREVEQNERFNKQTGCD